MMNYTNKVCSFTGMRTKKLNFCYKNGLMQRSDVERHLEIQMREMLGRNFTTFQCGMAIGADMMFAQIALALKKEYDSIVRFIAAVPCLDHDCRWGASDRMLYRRIIAQADKVVLVNNHPYFDGCMQKRNRWLVDTCDELLAVHDGQKGGTMQTIGYAKGKDNLKVTIIDPAKALLITLRESYKTERSLL
jgi:uncharacterized phage-like protein YoqJ